jgi:urease accessory protein
VLSVTSAVGNVYSDRRLSEKCRRMEAAGACERLLVSRVEMERLRLRRKTDRGTDVGLVLEPGSRLYHGDVLVLTKDKLVIVEQVPEKVISVKIGKSGNTIGLAALIGHAIGNRHRPIAVNGNTISFPIQADSEAALFQKLLPHSVKLKLEERVFQPTGESHGHEH